MKAFLLVVLVSAVFPACDKTAAGPSDKGTTTSIEVVPEAVAETPPKQKAPETVAVTAEGTKFDPPVSADQIPDGAWMCSMGGMVHYARTEAGDGKCAVCGMKMQQHMGHGEMGHHHE
jgi:hypothetical protein